MKCNKNDDKMNNEELLQNILAMIRYAREDKMKLQKIHDFLLDEIHEEDEEKPEIPPKYKSLIHDIAEMIDCEHICHLNTDTLEHIDIPKDIEDSLLGDEENPFQKEIDKVDKWENVVVIEPLESHEAFEIMEGFASAVPDKNLQYNLQQALQHRSPFANFKQLVDDSDFRQHWFDYKQAKLEVYVFNLIEPWLK